MTRRQYGISALVSQTTFAGETSDSVTECRLFSQAKAPPCLGLRCMKGLGFHDMKIKKICFSPRVSIQNGRPKSDSALSGAIGAQFRPKKLNQKAIRAQISPG